MISNNFSSLKTYVKLLPSSPVTCHLSQLTSYAAKYEQRKKLTSDSGCVEEISLDFRLQVNAIDSKDPNPTFCLLLFCWNQSSDSLA